MNPMWSEEMRDLVLLFIRRGKIRLPRPKSAEQIAKDAREEHREYEKQRKRSYKWRLAQQKLTGKKLVGTRKAAFNKSK